MSTNDHWITCPHCAGAGTSPADRQLFTDDEITEIGEPLMAEFRASAYERWCRACVGTGTILAGQRAAIDARSADERAGEAGTAHGHPYSRFKSPECGLCGLPAQPKRLSRLDGRCSRGRELPGGEAAMFGVRVTAAKREHIGET